MLKVLMADAFDIRVFRSSRPRMRLERARPAPARATTCVPCLPGAMSMAVACSAFLLFAFVPAKLSRYILLFR